MFLIEYDKWLFVNGIEINWVGITESGSKFSLRGESGDVFTVGADYCSIFFNHLQALNENMNIESYWHNASKKQSECEQPLAQ